MEIYHRSCHAPVYVRQVIIFSSGFVINGNGIKPCGVTKLDSKPSEINFICAECGKVVEDPEEIISRCFQCGEEFPITTLYTLNVVGGIYCPGCIVENYPDSRKANIGLIFSRKTSSGNYNENEE